MKKILLLLLLPILLVGCTSIPGNIEPVDNFEVSRYLGKWYEIARLDHGFEEGLSKVTADYTIRTDGGINVINRGFSAANNEWSEATGKAYFVDSENSGHLKVSFFGPIYSSYVVFELGENYEYAFVCGYNSNYLWLLSRTPSVDSELMARFMRQAQEKGFSVEQLIQVKH